MVITTVCEWCGGIYSFDTESGSVTSCDCPEEDLYLMEYEK
jgi:hypothetical protein